MSNPLNFLIYPMINILVVIYLCFNFFHIPYALGWSIIGLTILIRFALYPLTASQLKATKKMQELNPHIARLKDKHKNDAKMLQSETMKLYKEHGVNPLAGCLPILVQLPVIWSLYSVLQNIVKYNLVQINKILFWNNIKLTKIWDTTFFGLPLAQNPSHLFTTIGPIILLIPVATGLFQFIQSKMMFSPAVTKDDKAVALKGGKKKEDDFATAFQSQSMYIFPLMIGFFSWNFPIGLSLYWNTFTIFGIIQQYRISGLGGLKGWVDKYGRKKR